MWMNGSDGMISVSFSQFALRRYVVQNILTVGFVVEISFRLYHYRLSFWKEAWNIADLVLVVLSVVSTWLLTFIAPSASTNLYVLSSTLRLIRIMTVGRLVRLLMGFKELWAVISGFVEAVKTLAWISIFLVFVLYIAAVFVTVEIGQNTETYEPYRYISGGWDHKEYFGSVAKSMFTLFQIVTLDDWSNGVARHVMSNQPAMAAFFILFILFTSFGLMNVVIAIIVERTLTAAKQNQQRYQRNQGMRLTELTPINTREGTCACTQPPAGDLRIRRQGRERIANCR